MTFRCTTLTPAELRRFEHAVRMRVGGLHKCFVLSAAEADGDGEWVRRIVTVRCGDVCRHYAGDDATWIDAALEDVAAGVFGPHTVGPGRVRRAA